MLLTRVGSPIKIFAEGKVIAGDMTMKIRTVAGPDEVAAMGRVLDAYCKHAGITGQVERENVAARILALYERGAAQEDELLAALMPPRRKGGKPSSVR